MVDKYRIEFDPELTIVRRYDNAWISLYGDPEGCSLDKVEAARLSKILATWAETGELKDE